MNADSVVAAAGRDDGSIDGGSNERALLVGGEPIPVRSASGP